MDKRMKLLSPMLLLGTGLLSGQLAQAAGSLYPAEPDVGRIYGSSTGEPTCCYSQSRIWRKTNSQSGWSVQRHSFDPWGFPERESYQAVRPTPLPRGTQLDNPWTMQGSASGRSHGYSRMLSGPGPNADYFQPAPWHYPPPASPTYATAYGMTSEAELEPFGFTGPVDPYLAGLWSPALFGPGVLNPMWPIAPFGPGMW